MDDGGDRELGGDRPSTRTEGSGLTEVAELLRAAGKAAVAADRTFAEAKSFLDLAVTEAQDERTRAHDEARRIVEDAAVQSAALQEELLAELEDETEHRLEVLDLRAAERLAQADRDAADVIEQADRVAAGIVAQARDEAETIHRQALVDAERTRAQLIADAPPASGFTSSGVAATIDLDADEEQPRTPIDEVDRAVAALVAGASLQRTTRVATPESPISRQHRLEVEERCATLVADAEAAARYRIVTAGTAASESIASAEAEAAQRLAAADALATQRLLDAHQEAATILERARLEAVARRVPLVAAAVSGLGPDDLADEFAAKPETAPDSRLRSRRQTRRAARALLLIVAVVVPTALLRLVVAEPFTVASTSMTPTLEEGDRVLIYKQAYWFGEPARRRRGGLRHQ